MNQERATTGSGGKRRTKGSRFFKTKRNCIFLSLVAAKSFLWAKKKEPRERRQKHVYVVPISPKPQPNKPFSFSSSLFPNGYYSKSTSTDRILHASSSLSSSTSKASTPPPQPEISSRVGLVRTGETKSDRREKTARKIYYLPPPSLSLSPTHV